MPATSGPWNFDCDLGVIVRTENSPTLKIVCFMRGSLEDEEACANGALIASAPELLDACELVEGSLLFDREDSVSKEVMRRLRAAVRKAKGG